MADIAGYRFAGMVGVVLVSMMIAAFALDFVIIGTTGGVPGKPLVSLGLIGWVLYIVWVTSVALRLMRLRSETA